MSLSVTKIISFSAAHRLFQYNGDCGLIHGHNYRVEASILSHFVTLNPLTILVDFKEVKAVLYEAILAKYDHALILNEEDPLVEKMIDLGQHVVTMVGNPTAENMVETFRDEMNSIFDEKRFPVVVSRIRVWETDTSFAEGNWY